MSIGVWQLLIVLAIVVLIFGVGKLPKAASDVAQGIKAFKRNMKDDDEVDQPVAPAHPPAKAPELIAAEKVAAERDRGPV
ncbi:twin-arginine translocase TatA/TatE family subunit [Geminicoccus roseus]|uniref:twin-arginine translocase TatA/TatE family subunit n=1 Tax=Geminicoccus roseus TaxID=404900 RepID=UPI0004072ADF|nr:twin-arginine translocase TatA/TatE family subunit [Geminicoccus roseus]